MRINDTRFSAERRVKLILALFLAAVFLLLCAAPVYASSDAPGETMRMNMLRTSWNEENYSVFEASGNRISARGCYAADHIRKIFINGYEESTGKYSINVSRDGSYDAELSVTPEEGEHRLTVQLNSGARMIYIIYYSSANGFYFPSNGLAQKSREVLSHIYDAPPQAAGYYLSASADASEISSALEQIQLLAQEKTRGIESDYEKARALSAFVAATLYYDHDARNNVVDPDTIALYNVLRTGRTVCAGFSNLFCALCEAAGIDAVNIKGGVTSSDITYEHLTDGIQNHEFAAFYSEDKQRWVWADACWEGSGNYENGEFKPGVHKEMYFDITDEALSFNHRADKAERRKYFSALAEIKPDISETDAQALPGAETSPTPAESGASAVQTEVAENDPAQEKVIKPPADSGLPDHIYIVIIAVLAAGTIAVLAVLIAIIRKNKKEDPAKSKDDTEEQKMVVIEMENGKKIKLELYPDKAPITVENFESLVKKGFYDGLTFHRVIRGFMIQGGCPLGNGTGGSGKNIKGEFSANGVPNDISHERGVLSMARAADPNSASSQFFIMHRDTPQLDGDYAAFGRVVEGIEVVDEIAGVETDYFDKPLTPVVIKKITLE